jgi:excisionase family DNA binding protein
MPEIDSGAPSERLYGSQEAAKLLGVHRSTINTLVCRHLLVPDEVTPGGHLRFRRTTLDAFHDRLAARAATRAGATAAALRLLADVARLLVRERPLAELCASMTTSIPRALPGVDLCVVSRVVPHPEDRLAMAAIASWGLPDDVRARFNRLRTTFRFASTTAVRTLTPQYCEDATATLQHTGTAEINRIWPIGHYAILPIIAQGEAAGLIACAGHGPRHFSESDQTLLGALADLLAAAFLRERGAGGERESGTEGHT